MVKNNEYRFLTGDFDGDKKTDLFFIMEGKISVYELSKTYQLKLLASVSSASITLDKPILVGDFNGDGKADLTYPRTVRNATNMWNVHYSNESVFVKPQAPLCTYQGNKGKTGRWEDLFLANDFNNDGKTDVLVLRTTDEIDAILTFYYAETKTDEIAFTLQNKYN